ncbi:uncharacterized protein L199_000002 [Kwoniella botswanensis]|uniref:uncharacterized protein n=1 Tax=Kwoniella botswanensis TaxID=1268659 RepID=UPI00315D1105
MPRGKTTNPSGRCNRCAGILYVDLVEHFKKRHKGDRFTKDDISDTEVVVCACGRLVLNASGLNKHQLRFNCPSYSPAQRAARYLSNSLTPAPSTASLTPAQRAAPYLSNSLTPAPSIASLLEASPWRSTLKTPSLSPNGLSINHLQINSSPLTPTRRSSSRVTNPVLYVYDEGVFSHGQETEVYEEDGAGKEVEEDDDDEEEEEEEEEEIEDEAYWEKAGQGDRGCSPGWG